jgi:sulfatase modifying factor 1
MKHTALLAAITALIIPAHSAQAQGTLVPPGAPAASQKSLQEIWDKLEIISQKIDAIPVPTPTPSPTPEPESMILVQAGTLPPSSDLAGIAVPSFQIAKYEVTWSKWQDVRAWALTNGYPDLAGVGTGSAGNHPVTSVSWFDVLKWCNARSEMEGLQPVYLVTGFSPLPQVYRTGEVAPEITDDLKTGYRLPTEEEWEWAARGGVNSQDFVYSGSNDVNAVAWYFGNTFDQQDPPGTRPVGLRSANELGIHDMSGNVREWCRTPYSLTGDEGLFFIKGGGWGTSARGCEVGDRLDAGEARFRNESLGFRVVRRAP